MGIKKISNIFFIIFLSIILTGCLSLEKTNKNIIPDLKGDSLNVADVNRTLVENSLRLAENWLVDNLKEKGCFKYKYDPQTEEYPNTNNMIRQLMASRVLAEMSQTNKTLQNLHQKNLDFIFNYWYQEKTSYGYIFFSSKSKIGAMAMAIRTLVYSPFFENYQDEASKLANTVLYLQKKDGSFQPWYIEPSYDYDSDYLMTFYSGETILSLLELYLKTDNEKYFDAAVEAQNYYIKEYVDNMDENYYPAYIPWHTQSLNLLYKITEKQKYADAIMILNDKLLEIQDTTNPETLGRFYNPETPQYGSPHSSSDAVYTEGLAYAYEIAVLTNDTVHQERYKKALKIGIYNLMRLQYNQSDVANFDHPERLLGAVKYNKNDNGIRVDTTQHMIDAFTKLLRIF